MLYDSVAEKRTKRLSEAFAGIASEILRKKVVIESADSSGFHVRTDTFGGQSRLRFAINPSRTSGSILIDGWLKNTAFEITPTNTKDSLTKIITAEDTVQFFFEALPDDTYKSFKPVFEGAAKGWGDGLAKEPLQETVAELRNKNGRRWEKILKRWVC